MIIPYKNNLTVNARKLRKSATKQENHLWYDFLRSYPVKFRRQRPVECYIVDFYCEQAGLVIEIDGSQHYSEQGVKYDTERTSVLEENGLSVLRISNYDIDTNFEGVCCAIDKAVKEKLIEK